MRKKTREEVNCEVADSINYLVKIGYRMTHRDENFITFINGESKALVNTVTGDTEFLGVKLEDESEDKPKKA